MFSIVFHFYFFTRFLFCFARLFYQLPIPKPYVPNIDISTLCPKSLNQRSSLSSWSIYGNTFSSPILLVGLLQSSSPVSPPVSLGLNSYFEDHESEEEDDDRGIRYQNSMADPLSGDEDETEEYDEFFNPLDKDDSIFH